MPVEVVKGRAEALPFGDESFDYVVTTLALCSVDLERFDLPAGRRLIRPAIQGAAVKPG